MAVGKTVAVIGAAGLVGRAALPGLSREYDLRLLDRRPPRGSDVQRVDARRVRGLTRALDGCDVVVDLAADARWDAPWDSVYRNNMQLVHAVLEAAREAGVRRVVHASSNQVAAGYERDDPWASVLAGRRDGTDSHQLRRISAHDPVRPVSPYGAAKVFAEAACRWYSEAYGLSTICLRIGTVLEPDRPRNERHRSTWLSHRDLQGFLRAAIDAPDSTPPTVVWAASANTWGIWDVAGAGDVLGYHPQDNAEAPPSDGAEAAQRDGAEPPGAASI